MSMHIFDTTKTKNERTKETISQLFSFAIILDKIKRNMYGMKTRKTTHTNKTTEKGNKDAEQSKAKQNKTQAGL